MKKRTALIVAVFASPAIPAVWAGLTIPLIPRTFHLSSQLAVSGMYYQWSLYAMLLLGYPAFLLGRKLNLINWWSAIIAGCVIGAFVSAALLGNQQFITISLMGAASALTFWAIWRMGRDEDTREGPSPSDG